MNTLVGISPDWLYIFPVNVGSKKIRVFKVSQCCNNIDTNKEKEKNRSQCPERQKRY